MPRRYRVVDLFAGPGGLAEGFSSLVDDAGKRIFEIVLSVEKEESAHRTLTLRAFTRQFPFGCLPDAFYRFAGGGITLEEMAAEHPQPWDAAEREALLAELGTRAGNSAVDRRLDEILAKGRDDLIVIGGPPCQAYSLVGRARNRGKSDYRAEDDHRHFLYREYIRILNKVRPIAFVMENVKGMLSSTVDGTQIFDKVRKDLERAGGAADSYQLIALSPNDDLLGEFGSEYSNRDFVLRAEDFGVPQCRHRVIVLGLRSDVYQRVKNDASRRIMDASPSRVPTVRKAIADLPRLRSGLSREDSAAAWRDLALANMIVVRDALKDHPSSSSLGKAQVLATALVKRFQGANGILNRSAQTSTRIRSGSRELDAFIYDPSLPKLQGHESRGHMASDLGRYFFCSVFAEANQRPPKADDFPESLAPDHRNWNSGKFADRFRVQRWDQPSTTVVSHISKDGHYFIHPDPLQCRSLTVREAARLQTFPDNYIFLGNRTEQFTQVGNAVPPFLARQIAKALHATLWKAGVRSKKRPTKAVPV